MKRVLLAVALTLLSLALWSAPVFAATTRTDTLKGVEVSPGVIVGDMRIGATFVGRTTGDLPGFFATSINYTPPNPGPGVTNTIVGGTWSLTVQQHKHVQGTLSGAVTGGTAQWNADGTVATVATTLSITGGTGIYTGASGTGAFNGTLSHLTFPPTIGGTLQLTF